MHNVFPNIQTALTVFNPCVDTEAINDALEYYGTGRIPLPSQDHLAYLLLSASHIYIEIIHIRKDTTEYITTGF